MICAGVLWVAQLALQPAKVDPVEQQIRIVEALAAAEPPVLGVATQLKLAEAVAPRLPVRARRILMSAAATLAGIHGEASRAKFLVIIANQMAPLDLAEAERLARRIVPPDAKAEAWDAIIRRGGAEGRLAMERAFGAGAFRLETARARIQNGGPESIGVFAQLLAAYPSRPSEEDAEFLGTVSWRMLERVESLALEGLDRALRDHWVPERRVADEMRRRYPELYQRRRAQIERERPPKPDQKEPPNIFDSLPFKPDEGSFAEALGAARKLESPIQRSSALLQVSRRTDLDGNEQSMTAVEAMEAGSALDVTDSNRLFLFSMLGRDFSKRGDHLRAGRAAALLAQSFAAICRCETAACDSLEGREDCAEMVDDFAEYLEEEEISPDDLGIRNISLSARLEILKLRKMLGLKKKGLFGN